MKQRFIRDSFNLIFVVICDLCKEEYIEETEEGKNNLRERVYRQSMRIRVYREHMRIRVYHEHMRQPHYQQLKVKGHLRVCGNGEYGVFSLFQMRSQNTNLS